MQIFSFNNTFVQSFEEYKQAFGAHYINQDHQPVRQSDKLIDFHEDMMKQFFYKITSLANDRERNERRFIDYKTTFDILMKQQIVMERKMEMMMNDIERLTAIIKKQEQDEKHCEKMATYTRLKKELADIEKDLETTVPKEL
jgi:hypothetical protein